LFLIAVATVVSAGVALALSNVIEPLSASMVAVALGFFGTTAILVVGEIAGRSGPRFEAPERLGFVGIGVIGLLQGLAALPGLSRSGSTIGGGMFFGLSREDAARFGFLLGIPIITLAAAKGTLDVVQGAWHLPGSVTAIIVGFIAAGASGYLAIWGLLKFVKNHSLYWFAAYTGALGTVMLLNATVLGRG
jgi:undecaprenyl-diphosphatase